MFWLKERKASQIRSIAKLIRICNDPFDCRQLSERFAKGDIQLRAEPDVSRELVERIVASAGHCPSHLRSQPILGHLWRRFGQSPGVSQRRPRLHCRRGIVHQLLRQKSTGRLHANLSVRRLDSVGHSRLLRLMLLFLSTLVFTLFCSLKSNTKS